MSRKFSMAILDTLLKTVEVEFKVPLLGFGEIKFPVSEHAKEWWKNKKAQEDLLNAINTAEQKFSTQHPDNKAAQLLKEFSLKNEKEFQRVIAELLKHLDEQKITWLMAEKLGKGFEEIVSSKELQESLNSYIPYLRDELSTIREFREVITYLLQKQIANTTSLTYETTQEIKDLLLEQRREKTENQLVFSPEVFIDIENIPDASDFLPPDSRVPFYRNKVFTGRIEDLKFLADSLLSKKTNTLITQTAAAIGIGGIGKTQLAVEFCYRYGKYFHGVHWINARDGNIDLEIAACGNAMIASNYPQTLPDQLKTTLRHWRANPLRLIVFDNLEDPKVLADWLPELNGLSILVTARHREWSQDLGVAVHQIAALSRIDSFLLLRKLSPRLNNIADESLDSLAERLGDLPLALDLAGRYLNSYPSLSPEDYLRRLEAQGNILSHTSLSGWVTETNPTKHETSLASTFLVSLSQLSENPVDKLAKDLFIGTGYLSSNSTIPNQLFYVLGSLTQHPDFVRQKEQTPSAEELEKTEEMIDEALRRLSDIGLFGENNSTHPLISEFARFQQNDNETILLYLSKYFQWLLGTIEYGRTTSETLLATLHLQTFINHIHLLRFSDQVDFYIQYGKYLYQYGQYHKSIEILEGMLKYLERSGDKNDLINTLNILGLACREIGEFNRALSMVTRALNIVEQFKLKEGKWATLNNLGMIYVALGRNEEAIECYTFVLENQPKNYKNELTPHLEYEFKQRRLLNISSNLGLAYRATGKFEDAIKTFEAIINLGKELYGSEHYLIARELGNIGLVYRDLGKHRLAKQHLSESLEMLEKTLDPTHPDIATGNSNLGLAYQDLNEHEFARQYFEKALSIKEKMFGRVSHQVALDLHNLGTVLISLGERQNGIKLLEEATKTEVEILGENHYEVAYNYRTLAAVYSETKDHNKARRMAEKALTIDKAIFKNNELPIGKDYYTLGIISLNKKQYKKAVTELTKALSIYEKSLPSDNALIRTIIDNLTQAQFLSKTQ